MSKSLGNTVAPQDVIKQSGADILRMWACASDYADDVRIGAEILKGIVCINLLVFGICFVMMLVFTFLPPIVLTGLIALFLMLALITAPRSKAELS
jgi:hypothetical protein